MVELVTIYRSASCGGTSPSLKKWTDTFGDLSAWLITSEQLEVAAQAMLEHGYSNASANRVLSALSSTYCWAKQKCLSPRGFKLPTLGFRHFAETIRRVHVDPGEIDALRARALALSDRHFWVFVALLVETGARKSELLEHCWSDVDLERREVLAPTESGGAKLA